MDITKFIKEERSSIALLFVVLLIAISIIYLINSQIKINRELKKKRDEHRILVDKIEMIVAARVLLEKLNALQVKDEGTPDEAVTGEEAAQDRNTSAISVLPHELRPIFPRTLKYSIAYNEDMPGWVVIAKDMEFEIRYNPVSTFFLIEKGIDILAIVPNTGEPKETGSDLHKSILKIIAENNDNTQ